MKKLSETFLYQLNEKTIGITKKIQSYNPSRDNVVPSQIEEPLITIKKRYNYPLKIKTLDDYNKGIIQPVYLPLDDVISIPTYIPAVLTVDQGKVKAIVNITKYTTGVDRDKSPTSQGYNTLKIDSKKLFALMQTGTICVGIYNKYQSIIMNQKINRLGSYMYSQMVGKTLDKAYAINLNPVKADKVYFLLGRFFIRNILERPNNTTSVDTAYLCCKNKTSKQIILQFNEEINDDRAYQDLECLVKYGLNLIEGLEDLTVRTLINSFVTMYGTSTTFALEYFPYFCHMICSAAVGSKLNAEYLIESVVGKQINEFYNELSDLIKN